MKKEFNTIYIVEKFDTIETIAKKYNKNPVEILLKNNITPKKVLF